MAILERTAEQWWLGQSHWIIAVHYLQMGELAHALEAASRVHTIGTTIQDPRLPCYAAWTRGWIYSMRGDWELGIEACQYGLEHSPDPLNTSVSRGFLGYAYMEHGDAVEAISCLQHAAERMQQFHFPQLRGGIPPGGRKPVC